MSKAQTAEEKLAAQVVAETQEASAKGIGASGLATPKETVNVTITAILNDRDAEGKYPYLPSQTVPFDRPKGLPAVQAEKLSVAQAWSFIAQAGGLIFKDNAGLTHIYPLTAIHHIEVEVSPISGITLE